MINTAEMLKAFQKHRGEAIVIPGRGGKHWVKITDNEMMDATLRGPAMGGRAGFGLGVALAQPERKVVLFDSEGDIHMCMGMLATIAEQAPRNLYHFILDNEMYATTGGQPVPNAKNVDYAGIAKAAGYPSASSYTELQDLEADLPGILAAEGPVFVHMKVTPEIQNKAIGKRTPWNPREGAQVITDLRGALTGA